MVKADLERMVKEFGYWGNHAQRLEQDLWDPDQRDEISYKADLLVENERGQMVPALRSATPDNVKRVINGRIGTSQRNIINYSTEHLNEILGETDAEKLVDPALILNKEYAKMLEPLQRGDENAMIDYIKNVVYAQDKDIFESMEYLSSMHSNIFSSKYKREVGKKRAKFIATVLSDKIEGERGPTYELNKKKTVGYITENLPKANNKTKDNFYLNLAFSYLK